jgi:long-chain acyl-CoA synthetase
LTINAVQAQALKTSDEVTEEVKAAISRVNAQLADFERIRKFKVLDRDFSIEEGELTPTMKIRRGRVLENHSALVTELYMGREESAEAAVSSRA